MKYLYFILFLVAINLYTQPFMSEKEFQMMKEDDPNYGLNRKKWIEEMHKAAPEIDWKLSNQQIREIKHEQKKALIEQRVKSFAKKPLKQTDTVAGGKIIGEWIERGSNNLAGRMLTCDIDWETGLLYNASSGGNIWRGSIEGENWTCLNNNFQISGIILLKIIKIGNVKRIFVINGNRGYYSDNDGLTWNRSKGIDKLNGIRRAVVTNDESKFSYIIGTENINSKSCVIIYKSIDFGVNFYPVYTYQSNNNFYDLWTPKYDKSDVYLVHSDTLSLVKADGKIENLSIIKLDKEFNNFNQLRMSGNVNDNKTTITVFLQNKSNNYCHFYSNENNGEKWETLGIIDYGPFSTNSFEVSCVYPDAMYFGGVNCSRSHDKGSTWQIVNTWPEYYNNIEGKLHADLPAITSFKNPDGQEVLIISTDGGSYVSYDNLMTVKNISLSNLNVSQYYGSYSYRKDPDKIFVGAQDQGFQRTIAIANNKTHSFQQTISGDYGHLTSSDGGETLWCVYPGFTMLYKYLAIPSATRMTSLDFDSCGKGGLWMRPILADPKDPNIAYLAGGGTDGYNHIWKLSYNNNKISYQQMPYQFSNNSVVSALGVSELNKDLFYAMTNNGEFFYSSDNGTNWTKSENFAKLGGHYFYGASIAPSNIDPNIVYVAGSGYSNHKAYVSYDAGVNFTPIDSGLPNSMVYRIAVSDDDKFIFAATAVGPYVYVKEDKVWYDLGGIEAPDQTYWSVEYIPAIKTARFCTYGRGIWDFAIKGSGSLESVSLIEPADNSKDIELITNLKWTESINADSYILQIAKDLNFENVVFEKKDIIENTFFYDSLKPSQTYFWRIKAIKGELQSSWSDVFSFTTKVMTPSTPNLNEPKNNSIEIDILPTFKWNEISYATHYTIQVSESIEFEKLIIENNNVRTNIYTDEYFLKEGATYYWRVKAFINEYESNYSSVWKFTTQTPAPECPILQEPKFGAKDQPLNLNLIWNDVEYADFYSLELASDNKFTNIKFKKDSISWYSYKFKEELKSFEIYFWHVKANNKNGASDWSENGMFITSNQVDVSEIDNDSKFYISPNPFNEEINLGFELAKNSDVTIIIYNLLGREILKVIEGNYNSGNYGFKVTNNQLCLNCNSGIFIVKFILNGKVLIKKINYLP